MFITSKSLCRLAALSTGTSLLAASAAFATGGAITINTAPSLSLGASGLTQGLYATVWHVPPSPALGGGKTAGGGYASYGIPSPVSYSQGPSPSNIANVETYINTGSYTNSQTGVAYALPAASETFLNTNDAFQYNGGYWPTQKFLGSDAAGAAMTDGNPWYSSIVDQMGYIKVASAGTYTFNMTGADDAGAVYVGGTGITPNGNAGTGTQIVAANFSTSNGITASDGSASVSFASAGYYPVEVMNYQQGGGADFHLSVTGTTGKAASYYTTNSVASTVTPLAPAPTPTSAPTPTDEWNFAKSSINGTTVSDIGTAGSAATSGTIVGTDAVVSDGALVTTSNVSGNGMSVPGSTFANYKGSFSVAVTFTRSTSDPTNIWDTLMAFGDKGTGGAQNFIILQPNRQDGSGLSSMAVQSNGVTTMLAANNDQPTPGGQKIQEMLTYDASTNTLSLYINGVLQMSGQPLVEAGQNSFSLAAVADNVGTPSAPLTPQDGIGGLSPYGDDTTMANYYDLSVWNSALNADQVAGLAAAATPEPASLALMAAAGCGLALIGRKRRHARL